MTDGGRQMTGSAFPRGSSGPAGHGFQSFMAPEGEGGYPSIGHLIDRYPMALTVSIRVNRAEQILPQGALSGNG